MWLFYMASLVNTLRILFMCAMVEPGIIPKIRSKTVPYQKAIKVAYRDVDEYEDQVKALEPVEAFFSLRNFKLAQNQGLE